MQPNDITFYQRFETDILAGRKTITIRDKSESHFKAGDILRVGRFEDNQYFCTIKMLSVSLITLDELTEQHAAQENMGLEELKEVIRGIYPNEEQFFILSFKLIPMGKLYIVCQGKYNSESFYQRLNLESYQDDFDLVFLPYKDGLYKKLENELDEINTIIITDEVIDENKQFNLLIQEKDFITQERAIFALEMLVTCITNSNIVHWDVIDCLDFISDFKDSNVNALVQSNWVDSLEKLLVQSKINIANICRNVKSNKVNKIYSFLFCNHLPEFSIIPAISDLNESFIREQMLGMDVEQVIIPFFSIWKNREDFSEKFKISTVII